jgi:hypothetical protein
MYVRPFNYKHYCGTPLENFVIDAFVCGSTALILQVLLEVLDAHYGTKIADFHFTYGGL